MKKRTLESMASRWSAQLRTMTAESALEKIGELGPRPCEPRIWPTKEIVSEESEES